jgi:hypothetical protein
MLSRVGESDTQTDKKSCGDTENDIWKTKVEIRIQRKTGNKPISGKIEKYLGYVGIHYLNKPI